MKQRFIGSNPVCLTLWSLNERMEDHADYMYNIVYLYKVLLKKAT
jgi:hypothetical protein